MRFKIEVALLTSALTMIAAAPASSGPAIPVSKTYVILLTGKVPESSAATRLAGDSDGSGVVKLTVDPARKLICYDFAVTGIATPLMAHIHKAPSPRHGPSVVTLFTGPGGDLANCVLWTETRLSEIVASPSNFYVNLYTTEFPDGALRGQLAG